MTEWRRAGWGVRGGTPSNCLGWRMEDEKINNGKYIVAFCSLKAMIFDATTNQKQAATTKGTIEGRRGELDTWGERDITVFGGGIFKLEVKN